MAKRQVVLLGLGLALAAGGRAQQSAGQQRALGELFSGDASVTGAVLLRAQATEVLSGSQIAAGEGSALLKLRRGGQVRICPRTTLSLGSDAGGKSLSMGLDAGAMELQYGLESGADSLLTPDFRLQLISPGNFHLAVSVSASGDTCLRSLPGDDAAVFVLQMMGNESFQLSPGKKVLFRGGKISQAAEAPEICGCPETAPAKTEVAESKPAESAAPAEAAMQPPVTERAMLREKQAIDPASATLPAVTIISGKENSGDPGPAPAEKPRPAAPPEQRIAHLEVDSRFDYRGNETVQDFYSAAARLSLSTDNSKLALALLPRVTLAPQASAPAKAGKLTKAKKPIKASEPAVAEAHPVPAPEAGYFQRLGAALRRMFGQ
jgi:hypothetical protein